MKRLLTIGSLVVVGTLGFAACGDSEKKKSGDHPSSGGSSTGGASGTTNAGASGTSSGAGGLGGASGTSSAGNAGRAGSGTAGAAGSGEGGEGGGTGEGGNAGEGAEGGAAGEGGGGPTMLASKLDVLFVVDNSISMFEKQGVLAQAVPTLVRRLVDPYCIYPDTRTVPATNGTCPAGSRRELDPVRDMHVGVITTSLGSHGGEVCVDDPTAVPPRYYNDRSHLVPTVRTGLASWNGSGFLNWDPMGQATPAGESSVDALTTSLQAMIAAAGDRGCGYEAPLEAMYRFLVDPEPPLDVTNNGQFTVLTGTDATVLEQRRAFLRPDSAVIVVLVSDEDDCSVVDEPNMQGWLVGRRVQMPRGSDACAHPEDPNVFRCCIPCVLLDSPDYVPQQGCSYTADAACTNASGHSLTTAEDSTNLRCYRQTQRFGVNLLYSTERYVNGLTAAQVPSRSGGLVPNPLYAGGRSRGLVVLASIVGVPWQDLAKDTDDFEGFELMTPDELRAANRFRVVVGDPPTGMPPTDPFMIDSIDARSGTNPVTGQAIAPPSSSPTATINGHEQNVVNRDDLQYACTFLLPAPIPCTTENQDGCDCNDSEASYQRPLCQDPTTGTQGTTQFFAKAYPGLRELEVARRLGDQAVLASICPRTLSDTMHPSYGYVPAMRALQKQLRRILLP